MLNPSFSKQIKQKALEMGFSACGIAPADPAESQMKYYDKWISKGYHAEMHYMENHRKIRRNPKELLEDAESIVSVALNYYPKYHRKKEDPYFALYSYGKDYHEVLKNKLRLLWEEIKKIINKPNEQARCFTDSAPLFERYWAWRSGIGWIGKNGSLIIPQKGSFFFLGEIVTTWKADEYNTPMQERCGTCKKCIESCPTQALKEPYQLNANQCISYLTIENRKEIPDSFASKIGNRVFGCDTCQIVCPWNRFATPTNEKEFEPSNEFLNLKKDKILSLSREEYNCIFAHSAVKRPKYEGFIRNTKILK